MKLNTLAICAVTLCLSLTTHAATTNDAIATTLINALQRQHFSEAAAMLTAASAQNSLTTEHTLQRIVEHIGGFATMHPISHLPDGDTIKIEVPLQKNVSSQNKPFFQLHYASTAIDGEPVIYELNFTTNTASSQLISIAIHLPASDTHSIARALYLTNLIDH